ncbi:hypothetical protein ACFQU7_21295 [Pseudoroseomonas wenyumeiae]
MMHWEGPVICATPLAGMDARDYLDTLLEPPDLLLPEGAGTLLARLAEGLPIACSAVVERLDWSGPAWWRKALRPAGGGGGHRHRAHRRAGRRRHPLHARAAAGHRPGHP